MEVRFWFSTTLGLIAAGAVACGGEALLAINPEHPSDPAVLLVDASPDARLSVDVVSIEPTGEVELVLPSLSMVEGATRTAELRLSAPPDAALSISISSDDPSRLVASHSVLTFDPESWDVPQAILLWALEDADRSSDDVSLRFEMPGNESATALVHIQDADLPEIDGQEPAQELVINRSSIDVGEGESSAFGVRLLLPPVEEIRIEVAAESSALSVNPSALTFTPDDWREPQMIVVTALPDWNTRDEIERVRLSSPEIGVELAPVSVIDDDELRLHAMPGAITVAENGAATFQLTLDFEPEDAMSVTVATGNPRVSTWPAELTFGAADWDVPRTITVYAGPDENETDEMSWIRLLATGGTTTDVQIVVDDTGAFCADCY